VSKLLAPRPSALHNTLPFCFKLSYLFYPPSVSSLHSHSFYFFCEYQHCSASPHCSINYSLIYNFSHFLGSRFGVPVFFFRFSVFFCPFHPIRTAGSCLLITDHKSPVPCFSPGIISYWGREDLLKKKVYIFSAINPPSPSLERLPQQPTPRAGESSRASTPRKITTPLPTFIYRADSPSSCWLESLL